MNKVKLVNEGLMSPDGDWVEVAIKIVLTESDMVAHTAYDDRDLPPTFGPISELQDEQLEVQTQLVDAIKRKLDTLVDDDEYNKFMDGAIIGIRYVFELPAEPGE